MYIQIKYDPFMRERFKLMPNVELGDIDNLYVYQVFVCENRRAPAQA